MNIPLIVKPLTKNSTNAVEPPYSKIQNFNSIFPHFLSN
uniref:Uncharacterized protein n=1 Tax=Rhizophora mucronata TaxID=61149 RepID=A0A2P2JEG6_RHIMU